MKFKKILTYLSISLVLIIEAKAEVKVESNRIAVVVNKYLKQEIENNLNIYLQDLKNEGYDPILKEWNLENDPAPQTLKGYLKELFLEKEGLQGAVFIGDLPIPIMKSPSYIEKDLNLSPEYIAESYYMDLIGKEWTENENHFLTANYESIWTNLLENIEYYAGSALYLYAPEVLKKMFEQEDLYPVPEIWTSRITSSSLTNLFFTTEAQIVNAYLEKNHAYRTGQVVFQDQTLLYLPPEEMKNDRAFNNPNDHINLRKFLSVKYTLKEPIPGPAGKNLFFEHLDNQSYQIFSWLRHGTTTCIDLDSSSIFGLGSLCSNDLEETTIYIKTAFVFPVSCSIGMHIKPDYFAGSYVFNKQFYVLGMPTATLPTFGLSEIVMISHFVNENNLGMAFKKTIEIPYFPLMQFFNKYLYAWIASSHSRYILGDGTLKLQSKKLIANEDNSPQKYLEKHAPPKIRYEDIKNKSIDKIKFVLEKGIDLNLDRYLNWAIQTGNLELVKLFIENGADINKGLTSKLDPTIMITPLRVARLHKHNEIINFLINNGAIE